MRIVLVCLFLSTPAHSWEATIGDICTLSHDTTEAHIFLTFDPGKPLYTLTVKLKPRTWSVSPWFAMRFDGRNSIEIVTTRHVLSQDKFELTASDTGFGNVMDGLEYNETALAFTRNQVVQFPLDGAAPEVRAFRECSDAALS